MIMKGRPWEVYRGSRSSASRMRREAESNRSMLGSKLFEVGGVYIKRSKVVVSGRRWKGS